MTQCEAILKHLENHVGITQLTAIEEYGCLRLASRICDLRKLGYQITTVSKPVINRFGEHRTVAEYRLVK